MKIALVAPPWKVMVNAYAPLGLGYVSAALKQAGHQVKIFDFGLTPTISLAEAATVVTDYQPDIIGLQMWSHLCDVSIQFGRLLKEKSKAVLVAGGPHVTVFPEGVMRHDCIDFAAYGEAEETMPELVEAIGSVEPRYEKILGICYRTEDGKVVKNPGRPQLRELDELPFPDHQELNWPQYPLRARDGSLKATMMATRGCPYECNFCFKGLFGRSYRMRTPGNILDEVQVLRNMYGINHIYFVDDLFVYHARFLRAFCNEIFARKMNFKWTCLARVDRIGPEMYHMIAAAGCEEMHFGIESGNIDVLNRIEKHTTLEKIEQAVRWAKEAGIRTKGYFMVGMPGDTLQTMQQTVDFAISLDLDDAMFSLTAPLPGTELWEDVVKAHPHIPMEELFEKAAYYYAQSGKRSRNFFNLSDASDEEVLRMATLAPEMFRKFIYQKRYYRSRYGDVLGNFIWRLSLLTLNPVVGDTKRVLWSLGRKGKALLGGATPETEFSEAANYTH